MGRVSCAGRSDTSDALLAARGRPGRCGPDRPVAVVLGIMASQIAMSLDEASSFGGPDRLTAASRRRLMNREEALSGAVLLGVVTALFLLVFVAALVLHAKHRHRAFGYWFWPTALVLVSVSAPFALIHDGSPGRSEGHQSTVLALAVHATRTRVTSRARSRSLVLANDTAPHHSRELVSSWSFRETAGAGVAGRCGG